MTWDEKVTTPKYLHKYKPFGEFLLKELVSQQNKGFEINEGY